MRLSLHPGAVLYYFGSRLGGMSSELCYAVSYSCRAFIAKVVSGRGGGGGVVL